MARISKVTSFIPPKGDHKRPYKPLAVKMSKKIIKINPKNKRSIGASGEKLVAQVVHCCSKPIFNLNKRNKNAPGADHVCLNCGAGYQVKTGALSGAFRANSYGNIHFPKSKTFEATYNMYPSFFYLMVKYDCSSLLPTHIVASPHVSLVDIHEEYLSVIKVPEKECMVVKI